MHEASPHDHPPCPRCGSTRIHILGVTHGGTPNFRCAGCQRRFVANPKKGLVPEAKKELIRRLLAEPMALQAIARVAGVSRTWLQGFVNEIYRTETPWETGPLKKSGRLVLEVDELWSFVGFKQDVWWIWVALDAETRQIVAMVVGDRSQKTAQCLWDALPDAYQDGAVICSDFWAAFQAVIPPDRHAVAGKDVGLTNHV